MPSFCGNGFLRSSRFIPNFFTSIILCHPFIIYPSTFMACVSRAMPWLHSGLKWVAFSGITSASSGQRSTLWTLSVRARLLVLPPLPHLLPLSRCFPRAVSSSRTRTRSNSRPHICSASILLLTGRPLWPTFFSPYAVRYCSSFFLVWTVLLTTLQCSNCSPLHRPTADRAGASGGGGLQLDRRQRLGGTCGRDEWTGASPYAHFSSLTFALVSSLQAALVASLLSIYLFTYVQCASVTAGASRRWTRCSSRAHPLSQFSPRRRHSTRHRCWLPMPTICQERGLLSEERRAHSCASSRSSCRSPSTQRSSRVESWSEPHSMWWQRENNSCVRSCSIYIYIYIYDACYWFLVA